MGKVMNRIKFDNALIKIISLFEALTRAEVKDCLLDDRSAIFVVGQNQISKAIGKRGSNVRLLEQKLKKKVKIVEFNPNVVTFIKNLIMPLIVDEIKEDDKVVTLISKDSKTRGLLIGRNAKNLRNYESIVKRYFNIDELKVM